MRFTKMHGCGNDYILVDCRPGGEEVPDPPAAALHIADRRKGVGSDGLILVRPAGDADARMEMYNADGSRGAMCGNGIRLFAKFLLEHDPACGQALAGPLAPDDLVSAVAADANRFRDGRLRAAVSAALSAVFADHPQRRSPASLRTLLIETDAGPRRVYGIWQDDRVDDVIVNMGPASLRLADINCGLTGRAAIDREVKVAATAFRITCVYNGNIHAVVFTDDLEAVPLAEWGPAIERADEGRLFPDRANVHFVSFDSAGSLRMRIWERGSGVTLACGTGACAAVVAAMVTGRLDPAARESSSTVCRVEMPGGAVHVHVGAAIVAPGESKSRENDADIPLEYAPVLLTGPAVRICTGNA